MKRRNVNFGKNLKQRSCEVFNTDKESEVMKYLTLHGLLHRFIAS
jgi:hypothetical protein